MTRRRGGLALVLLLLMLPSRPVAAHEGSTSYLFLDAGDGVTGRFDIALIDVALAVPLDADADRRLNWNEVWAAREAIGAFVAERLRLARGGERCALQAGAPWLTERLGLPYLSVDLAARCPRAGTLRVSSTLFDADTSHRVLLAVATGAAVEAATLAPSAPSWTQPAAPSAWRTALAFLAQGVWHVWTGYDHLLFLLLLLLPAVVTRGEDGRGRARSIALELARVVTAFTVAHSVTLVLAATGTVSLPVQPVEAAIALSIVIAALLNLLPRFGRVRLPLAFGFGLVHGFGFANALAGLGAGTPPWPALLGFNLGVEAGNLAIVLALLPFLLRASRRRWYAPQALPALSLASALVGAGWLIGRL